MRRMVRQLLEQKRYGIRRLAPRGQSGIEFLAVTGIGMLLLLGVSFFLLADSRSSRDQAEVQQAAQIGSELIGQARIVQAQGRNSWVTVEANIPSSVQSIYTVEDNTIVFEVGTSNGLVSEPVFSFIPVQGWYYVGARKYLYNATATPVVGGGVMRFTVTANGTTVLISGQ